MTDPLYLGAYWKDRPRTLREYIADSRRFLARLQALHLVFRELVSWGRTQDSGVPLLPDLSNLDELLLQHAPSEEALFSPPGPTLDSTCSRGFITSYSNVPPRPEQKVGLLVTAGVASPWLGNAVVLSFPMAVPEFQEYGFVRRLLEAVVDSWAPRMAVVSSNALNEALDGQRGSKAIGWMNWFDDPAVRQTLPEGAECEPLAGGLLVTTAREVPSPQTPASLATARRIRDSLRAHGLLK